jgi:hypothetical protein
VDEEQRFEHIFKLLASDHHNEYMVIDAAIVRGDQFILEFQLLVGWDHFAFRRQIFSGR